MTDTSTPTGAPGEIATEFLAELAKILDGAGVSDSHYGLRPLDRVRAVVAAFAVEKAKHIDTRRMIGTIREERTKEIARLRSLPLDAPAEAKQATPEEAAETEQVVLDASRLMAEIPADSPHYRTIVEDLKAEARAMGIPADLGDGPSVNPGAVSVGLFGDIQYEQGPFYGYGVNSRTMPKDATPEQQAKFYQQLLADNTAEAERHATRAHERIQHCEMLLRYGSRRAIKEEREYIIQEASYRAAQERKSKDPGHADGILAGGGESGGGGIFKSNGGTGNRRGDE